MRSDFSQEFSVKKGVRQACIPSLTLFNAYSEILCREALIDLDKGIKINVERIKNLRYADDTILMADSTEGLQILRDRLVTDTE